MHIVQFSRIDDRSQGSISSSAPIGAEAPGDFTMDYRGTQGTLAAVIGGLNVRSIQEDKQAKAVFAEAALQAGGFFLAQGAFEQPVAQVLDPLDLLGILIGWQLLALAMQMMSAANESERLIWEALLRTPTSKAL